MIPPLDPSVMQRTKDIIFGTAENLDRNHGLDNHIIRALNDKTGSSFKEECVISYLGIEHRGLKKHGSDGFRNGRLVEFKPETFYEGIRKYHLTGGASFNDITQKKNLYYINIDLLMITAGFYEENLLYILEFPYRIIGECMKTKISDTIAYNQKRTDDKTTRVVPRFSYFDYKDYADVKLIFRRKDIYSYEKCMTSQFYRYIMSEFPAGARVTPTCDKQVNPLDSSFFEIKKHA
jgi:hypothetical protein